MSHQEYREKLLLLLYDELSETERRQVEDHLKTCADCRAEVEERRRFFHTVPLESAPEVSDELLQAARLELRGALRIERSRPPAIGSRIVAFVRPWVPTYRVAIGLAAALAVGVLTGYMLFAGSGAINPRGSEVPASEKLEISNVRFLNTDTQSGEVEFSFDAIRPMRIKGRVNDANVQRVLTYALLKEQNPGVRLQAVTTVAASKPDRDIEGALIASLKFDQNAGVRKEAFSVLQRYPYSNDVKDAFLYVLQNDQNPALRIEAIKNLETRKLTADQDVIDALRERMQSDDNDYVRSKAKGILEEVRAK